MKLNYLKKLETEIIKNNLCSGCGTCAGVCFKECISFNNSDFKPVFSYEKCINCGLCYKSCPSRGFEFSTLKKDNVFWDDRIGPYIKFINSSSTDEKLCKNGASGGTVSAIFKYVLEKKIVEKILCIKKENNEYKGFLTNDVKVLQKTQGSKYIPVPLNSLFKEIIKNKYTVAIVGTPCELQGLYLVTQNIPKLKELIKYKVGIFCGYIQNQRSLKALRKYLKVENNEWLFDGWRCGKYPGYVCFTNPKTKEQRKLLIYDAYNILIPFYSLEKCFMCPDGTNMCADFSFGDIHSRGNDKNSGIIRTKEGLELIMSMCRDGYLDISEETFEKAMQGTVGSVSYLKGMRALLYIQLSKNQKPKYDMVLNKNYYSKFLLLQNIVLLLLYKFVRKPYILSFLEKYPNLQMKIGRYIYTFPNRVLLYGLLKKLKNFIKRK